MNELSLTIIRVAFLAVLWLFVIAAIGVVRTDLLGGTSTTARRGRARQGQAPRPGRPAKPPRPGRGAPRVLVDLGSTNGTFVNGQPVRRVALTDGTRISLGRTALVFRQDGPGPEDGQGSAYVRTSY